MNESPYISSARLLFQLKNKNEIGEGWNEKDSKTLSDAMKMSDWVSVIAAAIVVATGNLARFPEALSILKSAIELEGIPVFAELLVYEALTCLDRDEINSMKESIISFAKRTITLRRINCDNTIVVVGRLAAGGDTDARNLIRKLANDYDNDVRRQASGFLRDM